MREFSVFRNAEHYYDPTAGGAIKNIEEGEKIMKKFAKGDIWYCNTGRMNKAPVLIVSDMEQMKDGYVIVSAITSKEPTAEPDPAACEILTRYPSVAHLNNLRTVPMGDLEEFMRSCTDAEMERVDECLRFVLDLPGNDCSSEPCEDAENEDLKYKENRIAELETIRDNLCEKIEYLKMELETANKNPERTHRAEAERDIYKQQYEMLLEKLLQR